MNPLAPEGFPPNMSFYIKPNKTNPNGFKGQMHTQEARGRMSDAKLGKRPSDETKEKIGTGVRIRLAAKGILKKCLIPKGGSKR